MSKIKILGVDPSTSNFGMAKMLVDLDSGKLEVEDLILIQTESEKNKGVRKDSDDLRRAREVYAGFMLAAKDVALVISEIPFMNPGGYAAANFNSGLVTGILASCPKPLIQVFPQDVKSLATGSRHAAKEEMIEVAMNRHPSAPWLMRKLRGNMVPTAANEHLADAVLSVYAGVETAQFEQAVSMYRAMVA